MRGARGAGAVLLGAALLAAGAATASPRIHRTRLPPPVVLPSQLTVDETEYRVRPSKLVVAAGEVRLSVYNRGMDDHDLVVVDADGQRRQVALGPGASGEMVVNLPPGRHRVWCTLFEGTTLSHEQLGMVSYIEARATTAASADRRPRPR